MALDASQNLEDVELLARFAKGDRSAAQILTARLAPFVFAQAYRMLGDRAEAEDITQDSLLRLWHAAPDWQPGQAKVTTWLYRVASNLCIDKMRKAKRHSGEAVPELPDDRPNMERRLQDRARAQALRAALGGLSERQKQAMTLRHLEGLSNPKMMDKDFSPAPLDDQDLEALFEAAQRDTPELDPKFLAQLQAQAAAALPQQPAAVPQRRRPGIFGRLSQVVAQIGGWPAGAGLAMAGAAGVVIGVSPPETVLDITSAYFQTESLSELSGIGLEAEFTWEDS